MIKVYEVTYTNGQGNPGSIRILADSEDHATGIVGRWETCFTDIQARRCQETDYAK